MQISLLNKQHSHFAKIYSCTKDGRTLVMALSALKKCKLCRIVDNCEFLKQGLNHFLCTSTRADVQMFGRVLWEVEGRASFYYSPSLSFG